MLSSGIKQRINSTYSEYNDGTIELEARFGKFIGKRFKPGVSRQTFNRIREYFNNRGQVVETRTTDYISKNVRKTVTIPTNDTESNTMWITKDRLWNQEDDNYGIRYSMSREVPIHPVDNFTPDVIREKSRYSYSVFQNTVRIDLTIVNMIQNVQNKSVNIHSDKTQYEVEVELINSQGLKYFEEALKVTLHRVLDTLVLYNNTQANNIIKFTNMLLGSQRRNIVDHYPLVQARNLKLKDMVWGGLIGNDKTTKNGTGYSVTHKADGQRKMLVFHSSGVWLVSSPDSLNRISSTEYKTLSGTILDGEMIPSKARKSGSPETSIWYLAFDCICWNNNRDIQNRPHGIRMNHAQAVADVFKNNVLYINTKTFRTFGTPDEFFSVMREMEGEQTFLSYKQDGFMFTPVNSVYNPHSDQYPLYRRVLTDYPDICKWKPSDQLTIDFKINWRMTESGNMIDLYVNKKGKPVLFKGTKIFSYTNSVDNNHTLTQGLPSGTIVEYGWDYDKKIFTPHKIRNDKTKPNRIEIAQDVWMDIQRPLTMDTMKGNSFSLLRAYHNRIKRNLYSDTEQNYTLLDIGSGRGGDVSKWKNFSKVVAVEPNSDHIVELKRRIKINNMEDKVRIVHAGGQDIEEITRVVKEFIGDRVDVVSMMLSMSFFWQNQSMVNRLVNTIVTNIKKDGKFIFLTIDGDLVEQTFEPAMNTGPAISKLELGPATLTYKDTKTPKELHIHIEDSIVQDQTEWLVRLNDMIIPMRKMGFDYMMRHRADEELFLNEKEITMTQMYTYGIIYRTDSTKFLPTIENSKPGQETEPALKTNPNDIKLLLNKNITKNNEVIEEIELPAIPMDTYEYINISWYKSEKVVRIGAIGDGSCFFHGILNGYYDVYQNNPNYTYRLNFVKLLRRDIAYTLELKDPNHPTKIRWETAINGQFLALYQQQMMGVNFKDVFDYPIDFSLDGLQKLINSSSHVGNEVYQYVSDILDIDIYVMRLTNVDLFVHQNTSHEGSDRKVVVISGNGSHYETIGIERGPEQLFQTVFDQTDPFILSIKRSQINKLNN